jgi:hypothetical protein
MADVAGAYGGADDQQRQALLAQLQGRQTTPLEVGGITGGADVRAVRAAQGEANHANVATPQQAQQAIDNNRTAEQWYRADANHENPAPMFEGKSFQDVTGAQPGGEAPAATTPAYSKVAPSGWDQAKWDDPNHTSAKYTMRKALDPFNAQQGFTPEAVAALNALGYGTFTGNGQHLSLSRLTDKGRAAKLSGDYQGADFINSYQNGANPMPRGDIRTRWRRRRMPRTRPSRAVGEGAAVRWTSSTPTR